MFTFPPAREAGGALQAPAVGFRTKPRGNLAIWYISGL